MATPKKLYLYFQHISALLSIKPFSIFMPQYGQFILYHPIRLDLNCVKVANDCFHSMLQIYAECDNNEVCMPICAGIAIKRILSLIE